jgi:hypothetical protein
MIDKIKLMAVLLVLLPTSALAMTADIDCYYYNHEEHFKNVDAWRPGYNSTYLFIDNNKGKNIYLSIANCIIREK